MTATDRLESADAFRRATQSSFWLLYVDIYPALVAASIPWSTTAVAVLIVIWLIILVPTVEPRSLLHSLKRPACFLPIMLFALALIGMLWADVPWPDRFRGIGPAAKLLAIPFLLYHFGRSKRGNWVFIAFLISCAFFLVLTVALSFSLHWRIVAAEIWGLHINNSIEQNQEFTLCVFGLAPFVMTWAKERKLVLAAGGAALIIGFIYCMLFVSLARTALGYMLVLSIFFVIRHFRKSTAMLLLGQTIIIAGLVWFMSPYLRERVENIGIEYQEYREKNGMTSTGQRLELWRISLQAIAEAPVLGHGTGATKRLFDRNDLGNNDLGPNSIRNPHNQTFYVALQWGALGCIVLYAMWYFHLLLFRERSWVAWIGLVVVVQNFVSSLVNSHIFDFHEGWMYVLGVGVAGGLLKHGDPARLT